jgi:hypothetical protein
MTVFYLKLGLMWNNSSAQFSVTFHELRLPASIKVVTAIEHTSPHKQKSSSSSSSSYINTVMYVREIMVYWTPQGFF